jgi:uncharacterized HAD superfamily protein
VDRIGFDIDGVIYPWHEAVLERAKREGLVEVSATVGDLFGYPEEEGLLFHWSKFTRDKFVSDVEGYMHPLPRKSKDVLSVLSDNFELFYVTARSGELEYPTFRWAEENNLPQRENLIVSNGPKIRYIVENRVELFIEDRPKYVEELAPFTNMILLTQPWNINYTINNHVRIDTLEELIPMLVGEDNE